MQWGYACRSCFCKRWWANCRSCMMVRHYLQKHLHLMRDLAVKSCCKCFNQQYIERDIIVKYQVPLPWWNLRTSSWCLHFSPLFLHIVRTTFQRHSLMMHCVYIYISSVIALCFSMCITPSIATHSEWYPCPHPKTWPIQSCASPKPRTWAAAILEKEGTWVWGIHFLAFPDCNGILLTDTWCPVFHKKHIHIHISMYPYPFETSSSNSNFDTDSSSLDVPIPCLFQVWANFLILADPCSSHLSLYKHCRLFGVFVLVTRRGRWILHSTYQSESL